MKEINTKTIIVRCNIPSELYPITQANQLMFLFTHCSPSTQHNRCCHPNVYVFKFLCNRLLISSCKTNKNYSCSFGTHACLALHMSTFVTHHLILFNHTWSSSITRKSGHIYQLVLPDDFSYFTWILQLKTKSKIFSNFLKFQAYIKTQF